jgi:hypothetical protein
LPVLDDGALLAIDARFEVAIHRIEEVVAVELGLESQDAAAKQSFQQFGAPGANAQAFGVRPGDVPEGDDGGAGQAFANQARGQGEVVVLHQHHGIVGFGFLAHGLGEFAIDRFVGGPVVAAEERPHVGQVAQRPQTFVGKAVVVAALFLGGEPHAAQGIGFLVGRHAHVILRSTDSRSAVPLPWATHTPEQARSTGSTAVTRPLAG